MATFTKKLATMLVAGSLALVGIVGCAPGTPQTPKVTSTEELLEQVKTKTASDNFHMDLDMDIALNGDQTSAGMNMNMGMTCAFDVDKNNTHGTMSIDAMGQQIDVEAYVENADSSNTQYIGMEYGGQTMWLKQAGEGKFLTSSMTDFSGLSGATFAETDGGYTLTADGSQMLDAVSSLTSGGLVNGVDPEQVKQLLSGSKITYSFDKDFTLTGFTMTISVEIEGSQMELAVDAKLSNHGKIDPASVVVPDNVKSSAVDMTAMTGGLTTAPETTSTTSVAAAA